MSLIFQAELQPINLLLRTAGLGQQIKNQQCQIGESVRNLSKSQNLIW
jgi:hypothetical protein